MTTIEPGTVIAGKYRLEERLGGGGMGSIWRAHDERLDVSVVVKFMHRELARDAQLRARFEREAKAAAKIRSPHVVHMYDHGIEDDTPYLVMELLVGEDLDQRMKRCGKLPLPEVERICSEICKGLHRAHQMGIIHRDLKPPNVFLSAPDDDLVKLLDFGIAKATGIKPIGSEATSTGELLGSPFYMSPEQLQGGELDGRSDLWAVAVILYRLLVGRRPFEGEEIIELCMRICSERAPPPSEFRPELGPRIDRFFEQAFCSKPDGRFQSAKELSLAFAAVVRGEPASDAAPGPTADSGRSWEDSSRQRAAKAAIGAAQGPSDEEATRTPVAASRTLAGRRRGQRRDRLALAAAIGLVAVGGLAALLTFGTDESSTGAPAGNAPPPATDPSGQRRAEATLPSPPSAATSTTTADAATSATAAPSAAPSSGQQTQRWPPPPIKVQPSSPPTAPTATAKPTAPPTQAKPPDVDLGY